jgi:hypothetical protein
LKNQNGQRTQETEENKIQQCPLLTSKRALRVAYSVVTLPKMVVSPMISTLGSSKAIRIVMLSSRNQIAEEAGSEK